LTATFADVEYRWQQMKPGAFISVPPQDWDDSINIINNFENVVRRYVTSDVALEALDDRDLVRALCQAHATCPTKAAQGAATVIDAVIPIANAVNTSAQRANNGLFDFLERHPYIQQITLGSFSLSLHLMHSEHSPGSIAGIVTSPFQALVGIKMSDAISNPAECSTREDKLDALISMVSSLDRDLKAMQTAIINLQKDYSGDEVTVINTAVVPCCKKPPTDTCGTFTGICTT
jgi:hypothetical protein